MKRIVALWLLSVSLINGALAQTKSMAVLTATNPIVLHIDDVTHNPGFIQWADGLELNGATLAEKVNAFFFNYRDAFGVKESSATFLLEKTQIDKAGNTHLKFQQMYEGLPFFGAQIRLHFDHRGRLKTFNGVVFSDPPLVTTNPKISYFDAISSGMRFIAKNFPNEDVSRLNVEETELQVYHQGLAMHQKGEQRLTYALVLSNKENIREHVFIDALNGQTIAHFSANCSLLHRELFLTNQNTQLWREGEALPGTLDTWQKTQLQTTAEVYQFFLNTFEYRSYDNLDSGMKILDQVTFLDCPNASWNGTSINFCQGVSSDDVVAHEWAHAYTEFTAQLLYAWQAGAINEAYSDIWGETIDLLNGDENQDELRVDCDNSDRWKIAENVDALGGAIRDMWSPNCHDDPGKVSDPNYYCLNQDFGGVHVNSSIVNHAYALLVDGGYYNGINITGIGLTKAAHIFWNAQRYYLTRTSDFSALADALQASCSDLKAIDLPALTIGTEPSNLSGEQIDSFDSIQLHRVLLAVEMRTPVEQCESFSVALVTPAPLLCPQVGEAFAPFFVETFEQSVDGWIMNQFPEDANTWTSREWVVSSQLPDRRLGKAMYAPTPNTGNCDTVLDHGLLRLQSPIISIPADIEGDILLTFNHYFSFEKGRDGGNIKVQRNGTGWIPITPSAFLHNGYTEYLSNSNNPIAGQKAFTGANQGSVAGSWGITQIKLGVLGVRAGDDIVIRWEVGTDGCDGWDGWYIDDVLLATCSDFAIILPVDYLYFNAKQQNNTVQLNWETADEFNNKGFHIERSFDGQRFNTIGWVASNQTYLYQFIDTEIGEQPRIYYRLRQEDFDGKTFFSDTKVINQIPFTSWQIYPNPTTDHVNIQLINHGFSPIKVSLLSLDGRLLQTTTIQSSNNDFFNLPLDDLTPGLYLIQMENKESVSYKRLIVE